MLCQAFRCVTASVFILAASAALPVQAADHYGLSPQTVELASAGPMAFGPDGVLFVGDPKAATVYAIDSKPFRPDGLKQPSADSYRIDDVRAAVAEALNADAARVNIADMQVDPESGALFLSVSARGAAHLVTVTPEGKIQPVNLDKVQAAKVELADPPEDRVTGEGRRAGNRRMESITDLAFAEGAVLVSGLSGASPVSTVQSFFFPFRESGTSADIEIFHGAHGRDEDYAAIRAFIPITVDGEPSLLAGFTCTPLVRFSLDSLQGGQKVKGSTVAELGNRNRPLDMIVYDRDDKTYLLITNSARGVMKIDTADVAGQEEITERVGGGGTAGVPFEQVESMQNIVHLAKLDNHYAVVIQQTDDERMSLKTVELP